MAKSVIENLRLLSEKHRTRIDRAKSIADRMKKTAAAAQKAAKG